MIASKTRRPRRSSSRKRRKSAKSDFLFLVFAALLGLAVLHQRTAGRLLAPGALVLGLIASSLIIYRIYNTHRLTVSGIVEIDLMTGNEFERVLQSLFRRMGYRAELTKASGDFGADLVLTDTNGQRLVVQAKRYRKQVGLTAVQEVVSSIPFYRAQAGIVVTNSTFTQAAVTLAHHNAVRLIDRKDLIQLLTQNRNNPSTKG